MWRNELTQTNKYVLNHPNYPPKRMPIVTVNITLILHT